MADSHAPHRRTPGNQFPGGHRGRVPPVPIPNTEVKPASADGTACVGAWESRSLPGIFPKARFRDEAGFFVFCRRLADKDGPGAGCLARIATWMWGSLPVPVGESRTRRAQLGRSVDKCRRSCFSCWPSSAVLRRPGLSPPASSPHRIGLCAM